MLGPDGTTKRCTKCSETKPLDGFHKWRRGKDGLTNWCKACRCAYEKSRNAADPERNRARVREWREKNPERAISARRHYYETHRSVIIQSVRDWRAANPDRKRAQALAQRAANPERHREYNRKWRQKNPEIYFANKAMRRAKCQASKTELVSPAAILARDCGICHICAMQVDPRNWHQDHIVPLSMGGSHTMDNIAVSHPWCNRIKSARTLDRVDRDFCRAETVRRMG